MDLRLEQSWEFGWADGVDWGEDSLVAGACLNVSLLTTTICSFLLLILNLMLFKTFWEETNLSEQGNGTEPQLLSKAFDFELCVVLNEIPFEALELSQTFVELTEMLLLLWETGVRAQVSDFSSFPQQVLPKGSEEQTPFLFTFMITETGTEVTFDSTGLGVLGGVLVSSNCKQKSEIKIL